MVVVIAAPFLCSGLKYSPQGTVHFLYPGEVEIQMGNLKLRVTAFEECLTKWAMEIE